MSNQETSPIGAITWRDLTVPNADEIREFYSRVVGWKAVPQSMGDYNDYCMNAPDTGDTVAGICHARGTNAKLPPQWLIYITVADVEQSAKDCVELGGKIIDGPRKVCGKSFYVIQDPAGAFAALIEK